MARRPQPLRIHLRPTEGPLAALLHRLSNQQASLQLIRTYLPAEFRPHCVHAELQHNEVLVVMDSPAWANRARYLSSAILGQLNREDAGNFSRVQIRVAPQASPPQPAERRRAPEISCGSARLIRSAADAIDDPALSSALRRLALRNTDASD